MFKLRHIIILCLALITLSISLNAALAVGDAWPMYGHDPTHTARSASNGPNTADLKWTYTAGGVISDPLIAADNNIYFTVWLDFYSTLVVALNPDGSLKWQQPSSNAEYRNPALGNNGNLYLISVAMSGTGDDYLLALDPTTGSQIWSFNIGKSHVIGTDYSHPIVGPDGTIYLASALGKTGYGTVFAVNPDGTQKWAWDTNTSPVSCGTPNLIYCSIESSVALAPNGNLMFKSYSPGLIALNSSTGAFVWNTDPNTGDPFDQTFSISTDNIAYTTEGYGRYNFLGINPDGSVKWATHLDNWNDYAMSALSGDGISLYRGDNGGTFYSIFAANGTIRWRFDTGIEGVYIGGAPVLSANGIIYFTTSSTTGTPAGSHGYVYAVRADSGELVWQYEVGFPGSNLAMGPDGTLYVPGDSPDQLGTGSVRTLYAFRCADGSCALPPPPAPNNDLISNARNITIPPGFDAQTIYGASISGTDPTMSCAPSKTSSVWYRYTAPTNQTVRIDTLGSNYDTALGVYTGTEGNLTEVACNNDSGGITSSLNFAATTGTTYYILVTRNGNTTATASDTLTLNLTLLPPDNDLFVNAYTTTVLPYSISQSVYGATTSGTDPALSCGTVPNNTVWYRYTPSVSGQVNVSTIGSNFSIILGAFTGTEGNLTQVACNTGTLSFTAIADTPYSIMVGKSSSSPTLSDILVINITSGPLLPPNDDIDNAISITSLPYNSSLDTTLATTAVDDPALCGAFIPQGYKSVWYQYTPAQDATITVSTVGSFNFETTAVWTGTRGALVSRACVSSQPTHPLTVPVTAGTTYYIEVAGYYSSSYGTLNLAVDFVAPTITSFTPSSGKVGASVTIYGTNFTGATAVQFNGIAASTFNVVSATSITATVPVGATTGTISVTTPGGTATSSGSFTVIPPPTITSFTPTSGSVGTSVTISGTNFTGVTAVKFNGTNASTFTVVSATSITATVPAGVTTGTISVTTSGGTATSGDSFTIIPPPTITSFTPTSGSTGTNVTISGTNLTGATAVKFHGTNASTFDVVSATSITATVPAGATTGTISVTTPGGTATSSGSFTVIPPPTIMSFTPTSGSIGTNVTISGMNFTGVTAVEFNGIAASFNLVSSTSIKAVVPIGAASGSISVTTPTGIATSSGNFTVIPDPANAAPSRNYFITDTPTLTWNRVTGAETYEIQVATTATFTLPLVFTDTVPADTLTVTTTSLSNGLYYWRVRALSSTATGVWSRADSFTVHVP